jgi:hypothetical protein
MPSRPAQTRQAQGVGTGASGSVHSRLRTFRHASAPTCLLHSTRLRIADRPGQHCVAQQLSHRRFATDQFLGNQEAQGDATRNELVLQQSGLADELHHRHFGLDNLGGSGFDATLHPLQSALQLSDLLSDPRGPPA